MKTNNTVEGGGEKGECMNWLRTSSLARLSNTMWSVALLVVVTTLSTAPQSNAQGLQKGISVQLARTSSAVPVPDADNQEALIITVTDGGEIYFGIDLVTPDTLAEKLKGHPSLEAQTLYIKADARAPYASVVKVLDVAHTARVQSVTLLTTQPKTPQVGTAASPEGIEMELARRSPATPK
jgi:biopolymer transport protein ExbD